MVNERDWKPEEVKNLTLYELRLYLSHEDDLIGTTGTVKCGSREEAQKLQRRIKARKEARDRAAAMTVRKK